MSNIKVQCRTRINTAPFVFAFLVLFAIGAFFLGKRIEEKRMYAGQPPGMPLCTLDTQGLVWYSKTGKTTWVCRSWVAVKTPMDSK